MIRILFVCVENAGRSQMAEAVARRVAPPGVEVFSAGSRPAASVNPVVVEAMRELRDLPYLMFLIVGDGVQKEALQKQVLGAGLQNVRFLSYQPRETLAQSYATADCFIVSLKPGLAGYITPSKLYGILAAGRPYVAAVEPSCDVARVTQKYRCGLLARPEDPSDIAEKIRRFYADPNLARELGANARKASEDFSQTKGVLEYLRLCQELGYHTAQKGGC